MGIMKFDLVAKNNFIYQLICVCLCFYTCITYSCPASITFRLLLLLAAPTIFSRRHVNTPLSSAHVAAIVRELSVSVVRIVKSLEL